MGIEQCKMNPPSFAGEPNPMLAEKWIMQLEKIFDVLAYTDAQKVSFAAFLLEGEAEHWWRATKRVWEAKQEPITWQLFLEAFYEKYFPDCVRDQKEMEFLELIQGNLSVAQYEAKFTELARFAPHMTDDEARKARKFEKGLKPSIRSKISLLKLRTYVEVVDRALWVEGENEELQKIKDKKGKTQLNISRGKREYEFERSSKRFKSSDLGRKEQQQKGLSCAKCGKNHATNVCYRVTGACFACGKLGHQVRDCPMNKKKEQKQPQKPTATARVFAVTQQDAKASKSVVEGIIYISNRSAKVLFDPGSNLSFVSHYFASYLDKQPKPLDYMLYVSTPVGDCLTANLMYPSCVINIGEHELLADLILLDIQEFDIILGMDWLSSYHATVDCYKKIISFHIPDQPVFQLVSTREDPSSYFISAMHAYRLLKKGCQGYLAYVKEFRDKEANPADIPIVGDFLDVFPDDLPNLPPDREVEFSIDLIPGTAPISKSPYRMAPSELIELKKQLQDLLDKGFIRPSVSP